MVKKHLEFLKPMTFFINLKKLKSVNKGLILLLIMGLALLLRFYKLTQAPPSLYWEEVALGYDAYSLLKTGKDHRGNSWPIVYLESYMDFKPPLYAYTLIPSIAVFGLNNFSVRFPSALFGSLTVLVICFLSKELFKSMNDPGSGKSYDPGSMGLLAALLLAISPWHLQFSRAAFEANLALFLVLTGTLFFIKALKKQFFLLASAFCFALSLYAYHGARVFSFLFVLFLGLIFLKRILRMNKIILIITLILGLGLSLPLLKAINSGQVKQRFQETSVFATQEPVIETNKKIEEDKNTWWAKIVHHRFFGYSRLFFNQYLSHFNGAYLFLSGDLNPRHSIQEFGQLYHWEIISLILGSVYLLKNIKQKHSQLIIGWLLIGLIPGAITKAAPHSLRTIFSLPAFIIISALGLAQLIDFLKNKRILLTTYYLLLTIELIFYLHFYYHHYPKLYSDYWQYGYQEAVTYVKENQDKYESIYFTDDQGRPYMYYLFYSQMEPEKAQEYIEPYRFLPDIPQIGKVYFDKDLGEDFDLVVGSDQEFSSGRLIKAINFLNGKIAFEIREK